MIGLIAIGGFISVSSVLAIHRYGVGELLCRLGASIYAAGKAWDHAMQLAAWCAPQVSTTWRKWYEHYLRGQEA